MLFCYSSLCFCFLFCLVLPFFLSFIFIYFFTLIWCFGLLYNAFCSFFSYLVFLLSCFVAFWCCRLFPHTPDEFLCPQAQRSYAMLRPLHLACVYIKKKNNGRAVEWKIIVYDQPLNKLIHMDYFYNAVMNFLKLDNFGGKDFQRRDKNLKLL